MPALVNINVGSLRGTSGEDGTISWPFLAKKFRKVDLISLTPLMFIQPEVCRAMADEGGVNREVLLDKGRRTVQKLCREIMKGDHGLAAVA